MEATRTRPASQLLSSFHSLGAPTSTPNLSEREKDLIDLETKFLGPGEGKQQPKLNSQVKSRPEIRSKTFSRSAGRFHFPWFTLQDLVPTHVAKTMSKI